MLRRRALAAKSFVSVYNYGNGKADVYGEGKNGSLTFHVDNNDDGPNFDIDDPAKGQMRYRAAWGISVNGKLEGWFVDELNKIRWFPRPDEKKQRGTRKGKGGDREKQPLTRIPKL
jgi:hypothetical protein